MYVQFEHYCIYKVFLTYLLKKTYPKANIVAVDIAEGMVKVAKKRINDASIEFICGDIESITLNRKFDLIVSNATFQWFNEPEKTLEMLKTHLNANGSLCFSTFGENTFIELHSCYRRLQNNTISYVKPGQTFLSKAELKSMLNDIFDCDKLEISEKNYVEEFDSCFSFFESIKKIGANNAQGSGSIKDSKFIYKVIEQYEKDFKVNNQIQATYHALFAKVDV